MPSGDIGKWGGRWEVITPKRIGSGGGTNSRFLDTGSNKFNVRNGESRQVTLVWHPNSRPTEGPESAECKMVSVTTGSGQRAYVNVKDDRNNALVHGPGGPDDWVVVGQSQTQSWDLSQDPRRPKAKGITVKIVKRSKDAAGNFTVVDSSANNHHNCYDAVCDLSVLGNVSGRPNGVQSRSGFNVTAHIYNRGSPPESIKLYGAIDGRPLILANNDGAPVGFWYAPGQIERFANSYYSWGPEQGINEPGWNIGNYGLGAKLYYDFNGAPGIQSEDLVIADCAPTSYDVYKQFDLNISNSIDSLWVFL